MPAQRVTETWLFTFFFPAWYSGTMDIWKHGTYVDTWSIVHFLSGFLLAGIMHKIGIGIVAASVLSVAILILWEFFEWLIKIIEPSANVWVDIVVGIAGFVLGAFLFYSTTLASESVLYSALVLTVSLSLWGFLDFYRRGYR